MFFKKPSKPIKAIQGVFDFIAPNYNPPTKKLFSALPAPPKKVNPQEGMFPGLTKLQDEYGKKNHLHAWFAYKEGKLTLEQYKNVISGLEADKQQLEFNRIRKALGLNNDKTAEVKKNKTELGDLIKAKKFSDTKNYSTKHEILGKLMAEKPQDFYIDSRLNKKFVGITHTPTKFKIHVPRTLVPINVEKRAQLLKEYLKTLLD